LGTSSERASILMDQLELQLGALLERRAQEQTSHEIAWAPAAPASEPPKSPRKPARGPQPGHAEGGGGRLRRLGEDITETLERVPATWKVWRTVREKLTCRSCEAMTQPPDIVGKLGGIEDHGPWHNLLRARGRGPNDVPPLGHQPRFIGPQLEDG
jgi:zinc-finger binding domain of transposase IS66